MMETESQRLRGTDSAEEKPESLREPPGRPGMIDADAEEAPEGRRVWETGYAGSRPAGLLGVGVEARTRNTRSIPTLFGVNLNRSLRRMIYT